MRWNWGHSIAAVYSGFALATMAFVMFAVLHPAELVSADYYARAMDHDRRQAAVLHATAVADRVHAELSNDGRALVITLPPAPADAAVTGEARLYRASSAAEDRSWPLSLSRDGQQRLPTAGMTAGRWTLQIEWRADGLDHYTERMVTLP